MLRTISRIAVIAIAATSASGALADDTTATAPQSTAQEINMDHDGGLLNEAIGIKPEVGVLNFQDSTGNTTNRGAAGIALDLNFSRMAAGIANNLYFGVSTGGLYSHVGNVGSNFFGTSPSLSSGGGGSNVFLFPADLKVGLNLNDNLRISGHGGGNVLYASVPGSIAINSSNNWNLLPNAGGDLDIGLGRSVALTLRPDWTFASNETFFTGTLEFGFAIG
jgi:hypothetical protein